MHVYSVALVIAGDDLNEAEISEKLGLKPTVFLKKGELMSPKRRRKRSSWSFDVFPSPNNPEWQTLEEGLRILVEKLRPLKGVLGELRQRYSTDAYCGHFFSGFGGGPSISPETLRELGDLGLTLSLMTYWHEDDADLPTNPVPHPER